MNNLFKVLCGIALCLTACDKEKEVTPNEKKDNKIVNSGVITTSANGVNNRGLMYTYNTSDKKLYYISKGKMYKADLNGANEKELATLSAPFKTSRYNYLYIKDNVLYYSNSDETKLYTMKTDGKENKLFIDDASGEVRIKGNYIYFLRGRFLGDLYRAPLNDVSKQTKLIKDCYCTIAPASKSTYKVTDDKIFYSSSNELSVYDFKTKKTTELSVGKYDNYVFTDKYIYFRDHLWNYGISRAGYDMKTTEKIIKTPYETDDDFSINLSKGYITFINRSSLEAKPINLYTSKLDGKDIKVLIKKFTPINFFEYPKRFAGANIIGDYIYYIFEESKGKFVLHRIRKDGTQKQKVKALN